MSAVEITHLTKRYGHVTALDDVTLTIDESSITGILGRNGAGKTVLMSIITAQDQPTSGTVRVFGEDPTENAAVLSRTCFIRDNQRYPDECKLDHVLRIGRLFYPNWDDGLASRIATELDIPTDRHVRKMSRGQLSAVGLLIGMASRAPLTFFDEPYLGLDATARTMFYDLLLADYAEHPRTILVSTHLLDEMENLLENCVLLSRGTMLKHGSIDELRSGGWEVSGAWADLEPLLAGRRVLRERRMGALGIVIVEGDERFAREARNRGLTVAPASLHDLVAAYGLLDHDMAEVAR
ncbi:ABC transporter ATP-binding protein [Aestuariimicrobium ganziense]|uniref:ABC transporter ATP-binding protein n=1 Tax=Aestuariimicrobium ganziense TaxID=2773677 RepID=UPI001941AF8F|nr:ABC transporter ATP-binding protein [Aestuariimicrobium ganziense]